MPPGGRTGEGVITNSWDLEYAAAVARVRVAGMKGLNQLAGSPLHQGLQ